jgi:Rab GTPase-binding effector protein 1
LPLVLDDSTFSLQAQEDADTLRSLVVPLEDEIQQLKEKLRAAYDEIEEMKGGDTKAKSALVGLLNEAQKESPETEVACSLCKNLETQLATAQEGIESEKAKTAKVEKIMERLKQDLLKESALRLDLEKTWQEKREEHKDEVQKLCDEVNKSEKQMTELQGEFCRFKDEIGRELHRLIEDRDEVNEQLEILQRDNDYLCGRYLEHSDELKAQEIDLPQNIDELHELVLRLNENLILAKTGQEFSETKTISFRDEASLLRDQMMKKDKERDFLEQKLNSRIHSLEDKLKQQHHIHLKMLGEKEEMQKIDGENKKEISDLRMQNIELSEGVERLEKTNIELRSKSQMMQQELATSEAVQKDFVKLSQSLQVRNREKLKEKQWN